MKYLSELSKYIAKIVGLKEENVVIPQKHNRIYNVPSTPYIIILENAFYTLYPDQQNIDLRNEIKICSELELQIIANNIDDIINLESALNSVLSTASTLADLTNDPSLRYAVILKSNNKKITRNVNESKKEYKSCIPLNCEGIVLKKRIENPIKIDLDMELQYCIMQHLHILNTAYNQLNKSKEIEEQILEMYVFNDICYDTIMLSDNGFIFCYQTMIKNHCGISEATKEYKRIKELNKKNAEAKAEKEERERREKAEKEERERQEKEKKDNFYRQKYSKIGDTEMNRYTDAVVADIKSNFEMPVFGGSTLSNYLLLQYEKKLPAAYLAVMEDANFTFEYNYYTNKTNNNDYITHTYSESDYPMNYGINVYIYEKDEESLNNTRKKFIDIYSKEKTLSIPSLSYNGETFDLKLSLNFAEQLDIKEALSKIDLSNMGFGENSTQTKRSGESCYCKVSFIKHQAVYHAYKINALDVANNHRLQLRMLQRAEFALMFNKKISLDAISQFKSYEALFIPQENKSFFGKAFGALGSIFETPEYKTVKSWIAYRQPINKDIFDKAFNQITCVYPILYDRMMQGYTPDQIKEEILSIAKKYNSDWKEICNLLSVYECSEFSKTLGVHDEIINFYGIQKGLLFCLKYMTGGFTLLISDAIVAYKKHLEEEAEKARIEAQRRAEEAAMREEQGYYDNPRPVRHGILHNAIHSSFEKSNIKRNRGKAGKRDLIGQAGCAKNSGGGCATCNLRYACSRYF